MVRTLYPQQARFLRDWNGQTISKRALDKLRPGCIARCVIGNESSKSTTWEAIYFELLKIKDGTFWGKTLDTYRMEDYIGLPTDKIFTFRKKHIMEIPITWQPACV